MLVTWCPSSHAESSTSTRFWYHAEVPKADKLAKPLALNYIKSTWRFKNEKILLDDSPLETFFPNVSPWKSIQPNSRMSEGDEIKEVI